MGQNGSFLKGTIYIIISNFISLFILTFGSIFLARILTPSEYGLYGIILILPELFSYFTEWGINSSLTRYIAKYNNSEDVQKVGELIYVGISFKIIIGIFLTTIFFILSPYFCIYILKRPDATPYLRIVSIYILLIATHTTIFSILIGLEKMAIRSVLHVLNSLTKTLISIVLILQNWGIYGAIFGLIGSYLLSSLIGIIFIFNILKKHNSIIMQKKLMLSYLDMMIKYGLPIFIGDIMIGFSARIQNIYLSWFLLDYMIGNYYVASNFYQIISLITVAITTTLFPIFSKYDFNLEQDKIRDFFNKSIKYSSIFIIPLIIMLMFLSEKIVYLLYTEKYNLAPIYLIFILIPSLYVSFGSLSIVNFIYGQGYTQLSYNLGLITFIISVLLSPLLIWKIDVIGLLITNTISQTIVLYYSIFVLKKRYDLSINIFESLKIIVMSLMCGVMSYLIINYVYVSNIFYIIIFSLLYLIIYLIILPVSKIMSLNDIIYITDGVKKMKYIYNIIGPILKFQQYIIHILNKD